MTISVYKSGLRLAASGLCLTIASVASAQSPAAVPEQPTQSGTASTDTDNNSGEIVVTATRRAANLQDVPLSITAVTNEALENRAATNFFDYGSSVPNLSFGSTGLGASNSRSIAIRGIADANTTGFYIDDTPVLESIDPRIVDVERIEVLRGPQGTLYGARSMGGTVRLITIQPDTDETSGRVHAAISTTRNTDRPNYAIDGAVNLPLVTDRIGLRVVGIHQYDAGYFTRTVGLPGAPTTTYDNVGRSSVIGGSAAALVKLSEAFSITPRILYQRTRQNGFPFADVEITNPSQATPLKPRSLDQRRALDIAEVSNDRWLLATLDARLDTGLGTLSSASSYFDRKTTDIEDETEFARFAYGYAPFLPNAAQLNYRVKGYTQEFRFTSDLAGPFNFIAGLFYNQTDTDSVYPPNIIPGLAQATGFTNTDLNYQAARLTRQKEYAAYAEATFELLDGLNAIAGARLFKVDTTFSATFDGFVVGGPVSVPESTQKEEGIQPKFSLQYELASGNQIYATAAKGFRPGSSNGVIPTGFGCAEDLAELGLTPADTRLFRSDSVWSYEVGAKTTSADRSFTANVAGFRIDWDDIQQRIGLRCGFSFRGNAGRARSQGIELEATARPTEGLTFNFGLGYTDAKFKTTAAGTQYKAGDRVPQVPKYTVTVGGDYKFPITDETEGFVHANYRFVSDSISALNANTDAAGKIIPRIRPAYEILDLRAGLRFGSHEIAVFAKNLTDERANLGDALALAAELPGRARVQVNQPRTLGIEFRSRFE